MNKRFSTLLAGVALMGAMSANAQQVPVTTKPAATAVANPAQPLDAGDVVYLDYNASWQIDFTGAWTANSHKDSLIWNGTAVAGRSKAHIDSLLFKVDYEKIALDYNGTATFEYAFTFTNKVGKFAFAKPAAKKTAPAYLNTNGDLNKWVLSKKYLTDGGISGSGFGYVPFVVATRVSATDDTPKTVYVLVVNPSGAMEVMEVNYNAAFDRELQNTNEVLVDFNSTTGLGTIGSGSYKLFRITGQIAQNLDITVASNNIKDAIGYEKPSFKFAKNVSEGEDNLLAAYNWEYTANGYLKAIGAKQEKTGRDLYLTVDTFYYDVPNAQNYKLALDTLPEVGAAADWTRNVEAYKFDIKASFVNDSITVIAKNTPKVTNGYFAQAAAPIDVNANADEEIIVKKFGNKTVLTTRYNGDATATPSITPSEFPTWELIDTEIAQFTSGDVYVIYDMNKTKADKKTVNPDYGKALIIDNMEDRFTQLFVKADKLDQTLPSHQWVALKKDNVNVYSFANRETGANAAASVYGTVGTALTGVQLYVVDAKENLYTYGAKADTIKMVKIDPKTLSPFDGYRHITKEEQMNKVFSLRFISDLLGDDAYVQQDADSTMTVAVGNKENAAEIRFLHYQYFDTIKVGVEDHKLTVVPYAVKIGRYFLAYDLDKKVYRFTEKQSNEAKAEEWSRTYEYRFVITKLAGGNVALVPYHTLYGYNQEKLAIDSENGNAVRVALDSDLRHAFELTEPANRIFAEVLGNTDTTLVKVNFHSVENLGWKLAKGADDFLYEGVTELKAGGAEYEKAAFDFKLDTAYVNRPGNTMPLYYITYDAVRGDSVPVAHIHDNGKDHVCPAPLVNDTVSGKFLFVMRDSLYISRANDLKYGYTYNSNLYSKLQMIDAKHINDTLIVNRVHPIATDTLKAGKIKDNATVEQMQDQWLNLENKALFAFRVNMDNAEEYAIYNPATDSYLTYLNGFVVASPDAAFYTLKDQEGNNVANEEIAGTESAVKVMATQGAVTVAGAQGKKVVISNILGQVVANTILTSDNATIAAPAGVVVVAVEGEDAVKAIVK
ncbi:DUF6383 domain-containing protein [uncultured Parabacteroides sp.]|uniref:DUF6383 domain-containing protein n=1 Tax=uncultured Parabacteroides sp. TaxID=512312 RepID=UPI00260C7E17|nr:DUF6383 domain-containing protein [uncultured Parabacteroides sp.]